ncbi:methyl-accepting chemotaxis protein [Bacillus sp. S/N-304-OC-R1]|nr:methyl-accepting chemotaxis protein [Bacillus sp. S/N-304-OC-R1]MBY0122121.1 methyl-accepting chemotaxis protein [Bacillus sp. S/N-304-OC-R1]
MKIRFSVGKKLYFGFLSILILMGSLGWLSIIKMKNINEKSTEIAETWLPAINAINDINYLTENLATLEYRFTLEPNAAQMDKFEENMNADIKEVNRLLGVYEKTIILDEDLKHFNELVGKWTKYVNLHRSFIDIGRKMDIINGAGSDNGNKLIEIIKQSRELSESMQLELDKLVHINMDNSVKASKDGDEMYANGRTQSIILLIIAIFAGLSISYFVSRMITKPLDKISEVVKQVADGNLTVDPVMVKNRDELGDLAKAFNQMGTSLANLIRQVSATSEMVAASSEELLASTEQTTKATEQITDAIQEVANGSEQQVDHTEQANQVVTEISSGMGQVAASIQTVKDLSADTNQKAEFGNLGVMETVQQMNTVHQQVTKTSAIVNELGKRSNEIGSIVGLITEISAQTNLLALNAAIEAARAGEHGRGFAVVADEVRKLAEQSGEATQSIQELIQQIQSEIDYVIQSMNEGTESVNVGIKKVNETGQSFKEIVQMINGISAQTQEVSAIVEEVNAGTEEMVNMISEIAVISKQSAGNTQNVAAAAEEQNASMEEITSSAVALSKLADELQESVSKFKV